MTIQPPVGAAAAPATTGGGTTPVVSPTSSPAAHASKGSKAFEKEKREKSLTWQKAVHVSIMGAAKQRTKVMDVFSKLRRHLEAKENAKELLKTEPSFSMATVRAAMKTRKTDVDAREFAEKAVQQSLQQKAEKHNRHRTRINALQSEVDVKADLQALKSAKGSQFRNKWTKAAKMVNLFKRSALTPAKANTAYDMSAEDRAAGRLPADRRRSTDRLTTHNAIFERDISSRGPSSPLPADSTARQLEFTANNYAYAKTPEQDSPERKPETKPPKAMEIPKLSLSSPDSQKQGLQRGNSRRVSESSPGSTAAAGGGVRHTRRPNSTSEWDERAASVTDPPEGSAGTSGASGMAPMRFVVNGKDVTVSEIFARYDTKSQGYIEKGQMLNLLMELHLLGNAPTGDVVEAMFTEADSRSKGRITAELFEACGHRFVAMQQATILRQGLKYHVDGMAAGQAPECLSRSLSTASFSSAQTSPSRGHSRQNSMSERSRRNSTSERSRRNSTSEKTGKINASAVERLKHTFAARSHTHQRTMSSGSNASSDAGDPYGWQALASLTREKIKFKEFRRRSKEEQKENANSNAQTESGGSSKEAMKGKAKMKRNRISNLDVLLQGEDSGMLAALDKSEEDGNDDVLDKVTLNVGLIAGFRQACGNKLGSRGMGMDDTTPLVDLAMNGPQFTRLCHIGRLMGTGTENLVMMDLIYAKAHGKQWGLSYNRFLYAMAMTAQTKGRSFYALCRKLVLNLMMHVEQASTAAKKNTPHVSRVTPTMARQAFRLYDTHGTGEITAEGIAALLTDLGVFGDDPAEVKKAKQEVKENFRAADKNGDGVISFDEFLVMYNRILNNDAMANKMDKFAPVAIPESHPTDGPLQALFQHFSSGRAAAPKPPQPPSALPPPPPSHHPTPSHYTRPPPQPSSTQTSTSARPTSAPASRLAGSTPGSRAASKATSLAGSPSKSGKSAPCVASPTSNRLSATVRALAWAAGGSKTGGTASGTRTWGVSEAAADAGITGPCFAKIVRTAGMVDAKTPLASVDIVFTKAKSVHTKKRLTFREFQSALAYLAATKRSDYATMAEGILRAHPKFAEAPVPAPAPLCARSTPNGSPAPSKPVQSRWARLRSSAPSISSQLPKKDLAFDDEMTLGTPRAMDTRTSAPDLMMAL